jgi:F-type H+-transporting ATPase subunit delta
MKKPTSAQYARAFVSAFDEDIASHDVVIDRFITVLHEDHMLYRTHEIILALEHLFDKEDNTLRAKVKSAYSLTEEERANIIASLKRKTSASHVVLEETVDSALLGGIDMRYDGRRVDGTLKTAVARLHEVLSV